MDKARGGELVTNVMTHFIYPTIPGFEQAGGLKGPQVDYNEHPEGDMAVAEKYMKLAGYPSGKYTGAKSIDDRRRDAATPAEQDAEIVNQTLKNLGFTTKFTLVEAADDVREVLQRAEGRDRRAARASAGSPTSPTRRRCSTSRSTASTIDPTGNVNWGQVNVPKINAAMTAAESVAGATARADGVGEDRRRTRRRRRGDPVRLGQAGRTSRAANVAGVGDLWNVGDVGLQLHLAEVATCVALPGAQLRRTARPPAASATTSMTEA